MGYHQALDEEGNSPRGLPAELSFLPGVGAAAARLPHALRQLVSTLKAVHQISSHSDERELRLAALQAAAVEIGIVLQEDATRPLVRPDTLRAMRSKLRGTTRICFVPIAD